MTNETLEKVDDRQVQVTSRLSEQTSCTSITRSRADLQVWFRARIGAANKYCYVSRLIVHQGDGYNVGPSFQGSYA